MRVFSFNVNNFGGKNKKPLLKDYKNENNECDWNSWGTAVDDWRSNNRECIMKNVIHVVNMIADYDVAFLYEVDTNCESWRNLIEKMKEIKYKLILPGSSLEKSYTMGRKSISCAFIKDGIEYDYSEEFGDNLRHLAISIGEIKLISVHMSYCQDDWNALVKVSENNKNRKVLIVGDYNTYDPGIDRFEYFERVKQNGYVDLWLQQGCPNNVPTCDSKKRIDYALATEALQEACKAYEMIINSVRQENISDHAAISVLL